MLIIPAIDLRDGRCVRLVEGRAETVTVFGDDPVAMARRWAAAGARRLHIVDLDGAFAGEPRQLPQIAAIVAAVPVPVEAGGGLRDLAAVEATLGAGTRWAILGTSAALDAALLDGKIYCAHSNFPKKPDQSDIRVLDPATMQLTVFHTFENPPENGGRPRYPWQKEHLPNLTGTPAAYRPAGHTLEGGQRQPATGDYEPWTPS